ncbi:MAG: YjbH domain-containing protein, partial [Shewanella sp.]
ATTRATESATHPIAALRANTTDWAQVARKLHTVAGYYNAKIYLGTDSITVVGEQRKFRDRNEAHQRAATILANNSDLTQIKEYRLIETHYSQPITETRIDAQQFAQVASFGYLNAKITDASQVSVPREPQGTLVNPTDNDWLDKLSFEVSPTMVQSFGGSEGFYMFNLGVTGSATYKFSDNLEFGGSLYLNVYDNYDKFLYDVPPDGTDLKRVRTLIRQYVHDNPVRINNLQLTWMDNLSDNISYQAYGGYLEMMYGGIGTEFLYRPLNSQWAFGFDINYAKQRDPDSMFGFFDDEQQNGYRVQTGVMTGHATAYYQPEWFPNTLLRISAGQYLTEDKGVTVDFSKQFDSGVIVGAFATKTNLSSEEYGEGSFTKGFYISIPFDLMTIKSTHSRAFLSWIPLTRDGGQMLGRKYNLFDVTDARAPWYTKPSVAK